MLSAQYFMYVLLEVVRSGLIQKKYSVFDGLELKSLALSYIIDTSAYLLRRSLEFHFENN